MCLKFLKKMIKKDEELLKKNEESSQFTIKIQQFMKIDTESKEQIKKELKILKNKKLLCNNT